MVFLTPPDWPPQRVRCIGAGYVREQQAPGHAARLSRHAASALAIEVGTIDQWIMVSVVQGDEVSEV